VVDVQEELARLKKLQEDILGALPRSSRVALQELEDIREYLPLAVCTSAGKSRRSYSARVKDAGVYLRFWGESSLLGQKPWKCSIYSRGRLSNKIASVSGAGETHAEAFRNAVANITE
jgi:hypothetical protein